MQRMSVKARMMVVGMVVGTVMTGTLALLIAGGQIGVLGVAAVGLLIGLAGLAGWIMGVQTKIKRDREMAWMKGYKEGRERGAQLYEGCQTATIFIERR